MDKEYCLDRIEDRLRANFRIERPAVETGVSFEMIARYHQVSGRTFVSSVDIIDRFETFETCYIIYKKEITTEELGDFFAALREKAAELTPGQDHFCTDITGVILCDALPPDIERHIRRLNFEKTFRMWFRGFARVRLVCVDLTSGKTAANRLGKEIKQVYEMQA